MHEFIAAVWHESEAATIATEHLTTCFIAAAIVVFCTWCSHLCMDFYTSRQIGSS